MKKYELESTYTVLNKQRISTFLSHSAEYGLECTQTYTYIGSERARKRLKNDHEAILEQQHLTLRTICGVLQKIRKRRQTNERCKKNLCTKLKHITHNGNKEHATRYAHICDNSMRTCKQERDIKEKRASVCAN